MSYRLTWLLLALFCLTGCQGGSAQPESSLRITDFVTGDSRPEVQLTTGTGAVQLSFGSVPTDGLLLHLDAPANLKLSQPHWSDTTHLLQLVAPVSHGMDIGLIPLHGRRSGRPVTLTLQLGEPTRTASTPPSGDENALTDLLIEQGGAGQVRLSWTEVNRGDYDFNGEVNIADLVPLSKVFGSTYNNISTDLVGNPLYWVDGDFNGEIGLGDLTVIGKNYQHQVEGYNVQRNGVTQQAPDGTYPTVLHADAEDRSAEGLPRRYVVLAEGSLIDNWSVAPLDSGGTPGSGNVIPPLPVDLSVQFGCTGLDLYSLNGDEISQEAAGHSLARITSVDERMRIIDPGDDIDCIDLGTGIGVTTGSAGFNGLPRGEWLLCQILLAPTVDPATGQPLPWPTDGSNPRYIALHVPVKLPPGTLASELTISAAFTRLPGGTYNVRVASKLRAGALRLDTLARLDYASAQVTADTDANQSFASELFLADPRLSGLSTARLQQLNDDNLYAAGTRQSATVTGTFTTLNQPDGFITTDGSQLTVGGSTTGQGTLITRLSEYTAVDELVISATGEVKRQIGPVGLNPGDRVRLTGYLLDDADPLPPRLWITSITRVVDISRPDKLYAWPDRTEVYPGEAVNVTVSTDQPAHPFFALQGVRITFNNATYVTDSFNLGKVGGTRTEVDGAWTQLGTTSVLTPSENAVNPITLPDGRTAIDFYAIPQDGAEAEGVVGELLNFKLSILGPVTLGLQRLDSGGVKRSYYTDQLGAEYFWGDDYNGGVPMVTVKDPGGPTGP